MKILLFLYGYEVLFAPDMVVTSYVGPDIRPHDRVIIASFLLRILLVRLVLMVGLLPMTEAVI